MSFSTYSAGKVKHYMICRRDACTVWTRTELLCDHLLASKMPVVESYLHHKCMQTQFMFREISQTKDHRKYKLVTMTRQGKWSVSQAFLPAHIGNYNVQDCAGNSET